MSFDLDKKFEHMAILHEGIWYVPVHLIEDARRAQTSASPVAEWVNKEQGFQYLVEPPLPDGTKLYTASASPSSTDAAGPTAEQASVPDDLSAHEDMARDAVAAVASMPRKDLKAAHAAAVEDLLYWRRRALTAEVSAGAAGLLGYIAEDALGMLRAGRAPTISTSTSKNGPWQVPIYAALVHAAAGPSAEQAAKESDARYSQGYSDGCSEGRADLSAGAATKSEQEKS